jgi:glycerate-2-kinase
VKDSSTWSEAWDLVDRYGLSDKLPIEILDILKEGRDNETKIQHKTSLQNNDDSVFDESKTVLVGNNALAVSAAASESKILGYNPVVLGTSIEGEAADIANMYVSMAQEIQLQRTNPSLSTFPLAILPVALIAGGETTVTLTENSGKGGRNQEIGLAAGLKLRDCNLRDIVIISVGTDGTDGPTDAAGAVVDGGTIERVELSNNFTFKGDNALRTHDAYNFFGASKDNSALVKTGATGTNVADVCVILIK